MPIFNYSLEALYQILSEESKKRGDGISKTVGYFQCLPATIGHKTGSINVAEIRFQNKTNMDFKVSITPEGWLNDDAMVVPSGLRIDCSCGYLMIGSDGPSASGSPSVRIGISDFNDFARISSPSSQDARDIIKHNLNLLVGGQIAYLSKTNK